MERVSAAIRQRYLFMVFCSSTLRDQFESLTKKISTGKRNASGILGSKRRIDVDLWFGLRGRRLPRTRLIHACNAQGAPCFLINLDHCTVQPHNSRSHWKCGGHIGGKTIYNPFGGPAKDRVRRTTHSGVAHESGATEKKLFVGGLHVRMRAEYHRKQSIFNKHQLTR